MLKEFDMKCKKEQLKVSLLFIDILDNNNKFGINNDIYYHKIH